MLAAQGGTVVIADMQADKGEAVAKDIGGAFVRCDVSSETDGQAVVAKAVSLGKLMGLVNCAGIAPAEKTVGKNGAHSLALFSKTITVNLIGSFNMIRLAADAMCKNEAEGHRRARRADFHRQRRRLRRPDRPGRLQRPPRVAWWA
jgi:NAD(P)-dependent dehydrogenase (short-subunit alcohol dehydrogenase family)